MLGADFDDFEIEAVATPTVEKPKSPGDAVDWPPLRIAIMPESTGSAILARRLRQPNSIRAIGMSRNRKGMAARGCVATPCRKRT